MIYDKASPIKAAKDAAAGVLIAAPAAAPVIRNLDDYASAWS